jgi:tetratricopeptide (TPR) repeat protein
MKNFEEKRAHTEALFNQGIEAYNQGHFQSARDAFAVCVDECQKLVDEGQTELRPSLAHTRMNLAVCLRQLGELALARTTYETALNYYQSLIDQGRVDLRPQLGLDWEEFKRKVCVEFLFNKGVDAYQQCDFQSAYDAFFACLNKLEFLIDGEYSTEIKSEFIQTLTNLENSYYSTIRKNNLITYNAHYKICVNESETTIAWLEGQWCVFTGTDMSLENGLYL